MRHHLPCKFKRWAHVKIAWDCIIENHRKANRHREKFGVQHAILVLEVPNSLTNNNFNVIYKMQ